MKRIISVIALVLAMTMVMSVSAFAAKEFSVDEADVTVEGMNVEAGADSIAVTVPTTAGADYSILLVNGTALPTVDSSIAYINQANATSTSLDFDVLPKLDSCGATCTLYIGSNAEDFELISVPVAYVEPAPVGPNVTLMNGATAVEANLVTDAEGNVTLPAAVAFNKNVNDGYTFTHYSWVTADGATEYLAGAAVAADDLEDVTLYAKYTVNIVHGDMDHNTLIDEYDRTYVHQYITRGRTLEDVTKTFATLVGVADMPNFVVGDIDNSTVIDEYDRTYIHQYITRGRELENIGDPVYYVNK